MSKASLRIIFAGVFAMTALIGAIAIQVLTDEAVPDWLVALIGAAGGYIWGHVQENGIRKPNGGGTL